MANGPGRIPQIVRTSRSPVWRGARWLWRGLREPQHSVCESLLQWALAAPEASVERVRPAVTVRRQLPSTLEPRVHEFFTSFPPSYVVPEKYLARVPGGGIVGEQGIVVLPDGTFCAESIYGRADLIDAPAFRNPLPSADRSFDGNYYSLLIKFGVASNYYHWLHDVVLRLHAIVDRLPPDTRFVVPPQRRPYQDESLAIVGVPPEKLWEFDGAGLVRFENLWFSPPSALPGTDSHESETWFRDRAFGAYGIKLGSPGRRIYVSRKAAIYRRIANEAEVEAVLREFGFETHQLEDYSLRDQVALFADAEIVVSPHGAALTNMMFSPPGLAVVDIFEETLFNKCFWNMSHALGHQYWYLVGETVPSGTSYAGDISVPLRSLGEVVEAALSRAASRP